MLLNKKYNKKIYNTCFIKISKFIMELFFENDISFNDYLGAEKLDTEYKEFTINLAGSLRMDKKLADEYCLTNIFDFNEAVILNLKKYIKVYLIVNACASFNSNIEGKFYIGVNDDGFVKGIPYQGELPIKEIETYIYKILSENLANSSLGDIDFHKYVKINITKINQPNKPAEELNPEYSKYLRKKKKHKERLEKYDEEITDWRIRFNFVNQKLFKLINNIESRIILMEYIKSNDPTSSVIDLLQTDYQEVYQPHEVVLYLKEDQTSPYYWITRWKDMMIKKLKKEKPVFIKSLPNASTNLIMNVSEMIPWWMHNNDSMNLYLIQIEFKTLEFGIQFKGDNLFSYYDHNKKKWLKCHRILFNGGPSCFPI